MSAHDITASARIPVFPWGFVQRAVDPKLSRGLYSCHAGCGVCGELDFCILVVMSMGGGEGPGVTPFCVPCLRQIPTAYELEHDTRFMKLRDDGMTTSYVSDPKQWKTRR